MSVEKDKADVFVADLRAVVEKHFGKLSAAEVEPLGMRLRQILPTVDTAAAGGVTTTTTATLYPNLDTDPPDQD